MSGRPPRTAVVLVGHVGRGGAAESQRGGFKCLSILGCLILCRFDDEVGLNVGRRCVGYHFGRMVLWMQVSSPLWERPGSAPPIAGTTSSL
jgi:hypothetical protein